MCDFYFKYVGVKLDGIRLLNVISLNVIAHIDFMRLLIVFYRKSKNIVLLDVKYDMLFKRNIDEINVPGKTNT